MHLSMNNAPSLVSLLLRYIRVVMAERTVSSLELNHNARVLLLNHRHPAIIAGANFFLAHTVVCIMYIVFIRLATLTPGFTSMNCTHKLAHENTHTYTQKYTQKTKFMWELTSLKHLPSIFLFQLKAIVNKLPRALKKIAPSNYFRLPVVKLNCWYC